MKAIPTKHPTNLKPSEDWNLPRVSLDHKTSPASKTHEVGKTYHILFKGKKISHDEKRSTYKLTHVHTKPAKQTPRVPLNIPEKYLNT